MTTPILAHFDGKNSLILDEPADLPVGTPLRVHVETLTPNDIAISDDLLSPVILSLDATQSQAIANDPEFASENL